MSQITDLSFSELKTALGDRTLSSVEIIESDTECIYYHHAR
jgi:hypothetical protein